MHRYCWVKPDRKCGTGSEGDEWYSNSSLKSSSPENVHISEDKSCDVEIGKLTTGDREWEKPVTPSGWG